MHHHHACDRWVASHPQALTASYTGHASFCLIEMRLYALAHKLMLSAMLCLPLLTLASLLALCSRRCHLLVLMWLPWTTWDW